MVFNSIFAELRPWQARVSSPMVHEVDLPSCLLTRKMIKQAPLVVSTALVTFGLVGVDGLRAALRAVLRARNAA